MSAAAQTSTPIAPNNSGINARDRADSAITAGEQSNATTDVKLAARIRRAIVKDKSLSMMAHNVKVVVSNGEVMLRGPVRSEAEKSAITSKAQAIAGTDKVQDQLEVASQ